MSSKINLQLSFLVIVIVVAAFSRVIPHMPNFSPLGAIALFGAAHFYKRWQAFVVPIGATWLSDLFINNVIYAQYFPKFIWFYQGFYWQYGSYLLIVLTAIFIFKKLSAVRLIGGVCASSAIFFIVSNFGVWAAGGMYPQTFDGLLACYIAAIPFLKWAMFGDLFYSSVLFGGYYLLQRNFKLFRLEYLRYV